MIKQFFKKIKKWFIGVKFIFILTAVMVVFSGILGFALNYVADFSLGYPPEEPVAVVQMIEGKAARERAEIKGQEIAKLKKIDKVKAGDYWIEITEMKAIEGGVEFLARAWTKNNKQIGFGEDGTVDLERFRIYNPPIMVGDGTYHDSEPDPRTGKIYQIENFKEDLREAILQDLAHTIKVKKQKFGSEKIISGKVGNTTSTFRPDAHEESTSVDGRAWHTAINSNWAAVIGLADGNGSADSGEGLYTTIALLTDGEGDWNVVTRSIYLFPTSSLGTDNIDSSPVFSIYTDTGCYEIFDDWSESAVLTNSKPASDTAIATTDIQIKTDNFDTEYGASRIALADWNTSRTAGEYMDVTLNQDGEDAIDKSGISKFGLIHAAEFDNSEPSAGANEASYAGAYYADVAGTTKDPKLVVEHSAAAPPAADPLIIINEE